MKISQKHILLFLASRFRSQAVNAILTDEAMGPYDNATVLADEVMGPYDNATVLANKATAPYVLDAEELMGPEETFDMTMGKSRGKTGTGPPMGKGKSGSKSHGYKCHQSFTSENEAASIGSLALATFWDDITKTNCQPREINPVYNRWWSHNVIVRVAGETLLEGIDALKDAFVGNMTNPGVVPSQCKTNILSWSANFVQLSSEVDGQFVFYGNEYTDGVAPSGREYTFGFSQYWCGPVILAVNVVDPFNTTSCG